MIKKKTSRFSKVCPRRLANLPTSACPTALLRIEFIQDRKREVSELPGCPYYVNDALSNYCWFCYCGKDNFSAHSTKEIARVLSLTTAQIEKAEKVGMEKLAILGDSEEIKEMRECLADLNRGNEDDTIYAIGTFTAEALDEFERMFYNVTVADTTEDEGTDVKEEPKDAPKDIAPKKPRPKKGHAMYKTR